VDEAGQEISPVEIVPEYSPYHLGFRPSSWVYRLCNKVWRICKLILLYCIGVCAFDKELCCV